MHRRKKLGEVLRDRSHISDETLESALTAQHGTTVLLGELLLERELVSRSALIEALQEVACTAYVGASTAEPTPEALAAVPHSIALRYCALPVRVERRCLIAIMAEPQNLTALDELRFVSGLQIEARLGFRQEIVAAIERCYGTGAVPSDDPFGALLLSGSALEEVRFYSASATQRTEDALLEAEAELRGDRTPAVRLLSSLLQVAAAKHASDIHLEQLPDDALVRIRVDGVLRELARVPDQIRNQLVSRIKILADMNIAEPRMPQDGRLLVSIHQRPLDLRVSTLPTQYGEKVVIRLLDSAVANLPFQELGLSPEHAELLADILFQPQGMVLVTGPTGSGKSTTLYSALNLLRSPRINIVSVEDPVEYLVEGVNQVQVNPKAGRTFANCLRSMLRQDPNVIMVGEIRDGETADIALTAAQTGHMVLSTLHTNDSLSSITRLLDLGVPPFLVNSSVSAIIAQRLVRKLCRCHETAAASEDFAARLASFGVAPRDNRMAIRGGCEECAGSGYKGRVGIFELLVLNDAIRAAIRNGMRGEEIEHVARASGLTTIHQDGVAKVLAGLTTLDEIQRVVPVGNSPDVTCSSCRQVLAASFKFCPNCGMRTVQPATPPMRFSHRWRKAASA